MASENKLRVFLDTNVIFSAFYAPYTSPGLILENFVAGKFSVIVSQRVLEELTRNLRRKLPRAIPELRALFLSSPPEIMHNPPVEQIEQIGQELEFGDADVFIAAINAGVDYFITGDHHFLKNRSVLGKYGLKIVSPSEFVKLTGLISQI